MPYWRTFQLPQAVDYFSRAIRTDAGLLPAFTGRGMSYFRLGQYKEAISDFDHVLTAANPTLDKGTTEARSLAAFFRTLTYLKLKDQDTQHSDKRFLEQLSHKHLDDAPMFRPYVDFIDCTPTDQ